MIENQDVLDLLKIFNEKGVRYLLVGGYAVIHYAEPRYTKDVDLFVDATTENAGRPQDLLDLEKLKSS